MTVGEALCFLLTCFKRNSLYICTSLIFTIMKNTLIICLALTALFFTSCKKETTSSNSNNNNQTGNITTIMDNIAGAYDVQHSIGQNPFGYNYSINMESLSVSRDSLLFIDKISDTQIKTYGFFNSRGVVDDNMITFDSTYCNGYSGYIGGATELLVSAKFENAYYSNGVINLNLRVSAYRTEDYSLYQEFLFKVIALKH